MQFSTIQMANYITKFKLDKHASRVDIVYLLENSKVQKQSCVLGKKYQYFLH